METKLRQARSSKGWSQTRLIHELRQRSSKAGVVIMNPTSLRTALSRWENGHVAPDPTYRRLLADALGVEERELGFPVAEPSTPDQEQDLRQRLASSNLVDAEVIRMFRQNTETIRRLDRQLGSPAVLRQSQAHAATMAALLSHAVADSIRRPLAGALADAATLAGWQALDAGAIRQAWNHYEVAKSAAATAEDPALLAHARGEQAFVLLEVGREADALTVVEQARRRSQRSIPPRLLSWLFAAEAEIAAAAVDKRRCYHSLEKSSRALPTHSSDEELPYLILDNNHLERWHGSALARLGDAEAIQHLESALQELDREFIRARGALHVDLARAYLVAGNVAAAQEQLSKARAIASQTGSTRQHKRIAALAA